MPTAPVLTIFTIVWLLILYGANSLVARRWLRLELRTVGLYVLTMTALGMFGEILYDNLYSAAVGRPLWEYRLLPIHQAYTSLYSLLLWGSTGFQLYLLHSVLGRSVTASLHKLAALFTLEAVLLEVLANVSFLVIFGKYIYYYLPADLWHITSVQAFPLYWLAGYATILCLRLTQKLPRLAVVGSSIVLACILLLR